MVSTSSASWVHEASATTCRWPARHGLVDRPTAAQADADLANGYGVGVVPFTMGGFAVLDVDKGNAEALIRDHPPAALYETRPARDGAPPRYHLWYRHDVPLSKSNWYSTQYRCGGQLISATTFVLLRSIPEWLAQLALGLGGPLPAHILDNPTPRPARAKKRALRRPREDAKPLDEKRPSTAVDLEDLRIRQDRSIYWRIPRARPGWRHDSMVRAIRRVLGQPGNWSLSLDDAVKVCAVLWRRHRRRLPWSEALAINGVGARGAARRQSPRRAGRGALAALSQRRHPVGRSPARAA